MEPTTPALEERPKPLDCHGSPFLDVWVCPQGLDDFQTLDLSALLLVPVQRALEHRGDWNRDFFPRGLSLGTQALGGNARTILLGLLCLYVTCPLQNPSPQDREHSDHLLVCHLRTKTTGASRIDLMGTALQRKAHPSIVTVSGPTHIIWKWAAPHITPSHILRVPFTYEQQNCHVETIPWGWD